MTTYTQFSPFPVMIIIKDVFYANQSFLVANSEAYEDKCPIPLHDLSLDGTAFSLTPNINFSFFYNCTKEPPVHNTYPLDCVSDGSLYSFATFHKEALEKINYSLESCHVFVNTPLEYTSNGGDDAANLLQMNYTEILKMGFLLNWTADSCSSCQKSGGRCGFDNNEYACFCHDGPHLKTCNHGKEQLNWGRKVLIGVAAGIGIPLACICIIIYCFGKKISSATFTKITKIDQDLEAFIRNHGIKRYSFLEVKKMTNSFKFKVGQGGYGGVYKGKLLDGRLVAVKVLNTSKGDGQEFINEVASISKTSHVNIVTLIGFCLEHQKRALIYEFMPNGSLEKFIYKENNIGLEESQHLGWENLLKISIGIAKGLEYLHRGCRTRILHLDIKPHNILLDEDFCPKISDFGLAKLCTGKESIVSMLEARGTIGYIAPEVFSRNYGGVSNKSDVYSYGMMVIEMAGGRKNINVGVSKSSEIYFPHWIYKRLELRDGFELHSNMTEDENEIARKIIIVGLWCIQANPSDRPSMSKVIEMLEGSIEVLQVPPNPFFSSPTRSPSGVRGPVLPKQVHDYKYWPTRIYCSEYQSN